ncbi:MAG: FecR family protein [Caulobacteraceae bacterium]
MKWETAREIDQAAADWAARVDRGLSPEEQSGLDAWLDGDARRLGAFGRMRAISLRTERAAALGPGYAPADFAVRRPGPSRRSVVMAGGLAAAGVAGLGVAGWLWESQGRFQTRKGEVRQLALEDGSVVTLNTASTVAVSLTRRRREVRLLTGEALVDVAHDPVRPFVVLAGFTEARAVGTSFLVRRSDGDGVQVLVREGVVEVRRTNAPGASNLRLGANMRAVSLGEASKGAPPALTMAALPESELHRALAWREGRIAFEGETLAAAAAEFDRYSDTRIVVDDRRLAAQEIAGLYQSNDPVGFAQAVAASLGARAEVSEGEVRIFRPAS